MIDFSQKPWMYQVVESNDHVSYPQGWDAEELGYALAAGDIVKKITFTDDAYIKLIDNVRRSMAGYRFSRDTPDQDLAARIIKGLREILAGIEKPSLEISSVSSIEEADNRFPVESGAADLPDLSMCPFCQRPDLHEEYPPAIERFGESRYFCVHATCCDYDGPLHASPLEAALAWNNRPIPE